MLVEYEAGDIVTENKKMNIGEKGRIYEFYKILKTPVPKLHQ
jgi:hypothetical protein